MHSHHPSGTIFYNGLKPGSDTAVLQGGAQLVLDTQRSITPKFIRGE